MPNTKPIGVAYEDQLLDGARFTPEVSALTTQLTTITSTAPAHLILQFKTWLIPRLLVL
jgi:hypothetical protein